MAYDTDVEVVVKFTTDTAQPDGQTIVVDLMAGFVPGTNDTPTADPNAISMAADKIMVMAKSGTNPERELAVDSAAWSANELTITLTDTDSENTDTATIAINDMLTVTLKEGLGIKSALLPDPYADTAHTAEVNTTSDSEPASATITFMANATFSVENTVKRPGAVSGYRIMFITEQNLVANQDVITVHFDKDFKGHGSNLSKSHVTVSASERNSDGNAITGSATPAVTQTGAYNPDSDASLDRLTSAKHHLSNKDALNNIEYQILVPDMNGTSEGAPGIRGNSMVTVVISPAAGIMNATEGGNKGPIGVFTSEQTALAYGTVTVERGISLSSYASNRNKSLTVFGSGFQNGTDATVYLTNGNGTRQKLVAVPVTGNDTFEAHITVRVPPFEAGTGNMIEVEDGNQPPFKAGPISFEVEGLLTVSPTSAAVGDEVDITLEDWPNNDPIPTNAVTIAGVTQTIIGSPSLSGGSANFRIEISTETPSGTDEIKVTIGNENDTTNITIAGADLIANPTTAVPNQAVTVTGRGFTAQATISRTISGVNDRSSVTFGNSDTHLEHGSRNFNNGQAVEVDSGGNWSASIIIPITSASTSPGTRALEVKDDGNRIGSVDITIPQRTLTIDPATARPGETVTLTGVGFPATNTRSKAQNTPPVSIIYGDSGIVGTATPDSDGDISMTFRVPLDANIPSTNRVEANYMIPGINTEVRTSTNHEVPGARLTLSMEEGKPGDTLTITGDGFKAFASVEYVRIGGIDVTPAPSPPPTERRVHRQHPSARPG